MVQQLVKRQADYVAVDCRHALRPPVFRALAQGVVERLDVLHGAFKETARKTFYIRIKLLRGKKGRDHVFDCVISNLPLEEHLQGEFASFAA